METITVLKQTLTFLCNYLLLPIAGSAYASIIVIRILKFREIKRSSVTIVNKLPKCVYYSKVEHIYDIEDDDRTYTLDNNISSLNANFDYQINEFKYYGHNNAARLLLDISNQILEVANKATTDLESKLHQGDYREYPDEMKCEASISIETQINTWSHDIYQIKPNLITILNIYPSHI